MRKRYYLGRALQQLQQLLPVACTCKAPGKTTVTANPSPAHPTAAPYTAAAVHLLIHTTFCCMSGAAAATATASTVAAAACPPPVLPAHLECKALAAADVHCPVDLPIAPQAQHMLHQHGVGAHLDCFVRQWPRPILLYGSWGATCCSSKQLLHAPDEASSAQPGSQVPDLLVS